MKITKNQAKTLNQAIAHWEKEQTINVDTAKALRDSYTIIGFDWKLLAVYSFWIAITCFIISIGVLLADDYLMTLLAKLINTPASVLTVISACLALLAYFIGFRRRQKHPEKQFSNEAIYFFGVLFTAVSTGFLRETPWFEGVDVSFFLLILTLVYSIVGIRLSSMLIWLFALLSFAGWGLEFTRYIVEPSGYFLGLNMAWRLVVIGLMVLTSAWWLKNPNKKYQLPAINQEQYDYLYEPTRFMGLLYLLSALWLISIVGNYDNAADWSKVSQIELIHWALLSGLICLGLLFYGIRNGDKLARSFGITFLLINLYTRFFEYFWDSMHKTIFFASLALSFWLIGTHAEKLWQISHHQAKE
ncbi:hypothetical protein [Photobacterium nomapromontoriensis]|uniref:hypothetical protein n=1 Tax=Photobacterium nomapromontoriensis TaxID=2910237 RepID=UPI003D09B683